jgi:hypothetical protein
LSAKKLVLCVVDSLRTDKLEEAVADGVAPTFAALLERGTLVRDCVSSFPSVTPVCTSEITTGVGPDGHWISAMNWYHRADARYVEYGSSFEATRAFGLFRSLYDTVYNMNMAHLSDEVETVFETLADHGIRTACTPFLIYRGRTRHEMGLEGLLRRVALAATFRHATWGPDELFYGELYSSRKVPCRPTLARPGTRDEYSACCGRELVENDLFDFLLFGLPDNDYHSHKFGPDGQPDSIIRADAAFAELVDAAGGLDRFLAGHAVIVVADHAQTPVEHPLDLMAALGSDWRILQPNQTDPERAELAVCPTSRAAGDYVLAAGSAAERTHAGVRDRLAALDGIDLFAWLEADGSPLFRGAGDGPSPPGAGASVDRRGAGWEIDGEPDVLDAESYPNGLARLWSALTAPHAAEILISADAGYEFTDWGGMTHCPGGSHGSLHAGDSLGPLLLCGLEPGIESLREQWAIRDVAGLVLGHFGIDGGGDGLRVRRAEAVRVGG